MEAPEVEWLRLARSGDNDAFSRLVELYQTPVFHLCCRMLGNETEAEDAAQETFLRAYTNLRRYDPSRPFLTWLLSIGAHYCIDQLRKHRKPVLDLDDLPEETLPDQNLPAPETVFHSRETARLLRDLLGQLGAQDRAAIILRYWYDFSEEEIAANLSLTVSAVKSRLHRARKELARRYSSLETAARAYERRPNESPAF